MSSMSTPTRIGRGVSIPGIDTRAPSEQHHNHNTILSYGGLHTPPQSAHESRRPSLQYSALAGEPCSASSTSFAYSHPNTPIPGLRHDNSGYMPVWPESNGPPQQHSLHPSTSGICDAPEPALQAPFDHRSTGGDNTLDAVSYHHMTQSGDTNVFNLNIDSAIPTSEAWRPSQHMAFGYAGQTACLGSALFQSPNNASSNGSRMPVYEPVEPSSHCLNSQYGLSQYPDLQYLRAQQPLVVVPSQLSPEGDYSQSHTPDYVAVEQNHDILGSSFASSTSGYMGYELLDPPSPVDAYFAHSDDDEYMMVKPEEEASPSTRPPLRRMTGSQDLSRPRKRDSKRHRKAAKGVPWHSHEIAGCTVQCEGPPFSIDRPTIKSTSARKPHACLFIARDGKPCGARFDRAEHLKRHTGSHTSDRPYPCPIDGCHRAMQRPDNARDHFRTHLRPKTKGKRNDHVDWPTLHNAIWEKYEDKRKAKKLLDGLSRSLEAGMADPRRVN